MIPPVLLVGFGKMGGAMMAGWREQGLSPSVAVDPSAPAQHSDDLLVVAEVAHIPAAFMPAAVILAVKPQVAAETLPDYARFKDSVMLSIMAGRSISWLSGLLHTGAVVRAMPNTPAAIRQGITVACAGPDVSVQQVALCDTLLKAVGTVSWTADEGLIDPVTAVSGGGPAYVFLLAELLEQAAIEQGVPQEMARSLARQTITGAGALLAASSEDASVLRRNVTSPGGTTERALAVMMQDSAWPETVSRAIAAATLRSRELGG
jgi:pyrroline-5-carboxylate reductase